jgi:CheY-like chemotaxis protein
LIDVSASASSRILLVDDSEVLLSDYRRILTFADRDSDDELDVLERLARGDTSPVAASSSGPRYAITSATQGNAAIAAVDAAAAARDPFSVVFLDVRMPPGIDGVETARRLWQVDPDLEIVLCSAHNDYSWEDLAALLGRTDHLLILRKPFDPIEVRQLSASLTEKWRRGRALVRHIHDLDAAIKAEVDARLADRARYEAELRRAERMEMLGRLSAALVHEISSPAQCVNLALDALDDIAAVLATTTPHPDRDAADACADIAPALAEALNGIDRIIDLV